MLKQYKVISKNSLLSRVVNVFVPTPGVLQASHIAMLVDKARSLVVDDYHQTVENLRRFYDEMDDESFHYFCKFLHSIYFQNIDLGEILNDSEHHLGSGSQHD